MTVEGQRGDSGGAVWWQCRGGVVIVNGEIGWAAEDGGIV